MKRRDPTHCRLHPIAEVEQTLAGAVALLQVQLVRWLIRRNWSCSRTPADAGIKLAEAWPPPAGQQQQGASMTRTTAAAEAIELKSTDLHRQDGHHSRQQHDEIAAEGHRLHKRHGNNPKNHQQGRDQTASIEQIPSRPRQTRRSPPQRRNTTSNSRISANLGNGCQRPRPRAKVSSNKA